MDNIFINKFVWTGFTQSEMTEYVESVFAYYRKLGFPYYPTDQIYRDNEFRKLFNYSKNTLEKNGNIRQTMHGLALCWSYHPYAYDITCRDKMTPLHVFNDDLLLKRVIQKRIQMGDNMSDAGLRKMLKIFSGTQSVSNFRPTSARAIYNEFCEGGTTWDMSSGFGGRLLGFETSTAKRYIGTDPSTRSFQGNTELGYDYITKDHQIICTGSEGFVPDRGSLDLVFTSPPYFDIEKYAEEPTQSYIKYPTKDDWLQGFFRQSIQNAHRGLKTGKYLILNVNGELYEDTIRIAESIGFSYEKTLQLSLSKINSTGFKYEPVIVFRK